MKLNVYELNTKFVDTNNNKHPKKQQLVIDILVKNKVKFLEYIYEEEDGRGVKDDDYIVLIFHRKNDRTKVQIDSLIKIIYERKFEYILIEDNNWDVVEIHIPVSTIHPYKKK